MLARTEMHTFFVFVTRVYMYVVHNKYYRAANGAHILCALHRLGQCVRSLSHKLWLNYFDNIVIKFRELLSKIILKYFCFNNY